MKTYLSLVVLYLKSFYNLGGGFDAKDLKKNLKTLGVYALAAFIIVNFAFLFITLNIGVYNSLVPLGLQGLLFLNAAIALTMMNLVVGFLMALSTYFLGQMETQFLAMPIQPQALFAAKLTVVYITELPFGLFFMGSAMAVFGIKENPHPLFYLWGLAAALLLPLPAISFSYLVQVPLLSIARFLKNKQVLLIIGGVVGMFFALGFNLYYQSIMARMGDPQWLADHMTGPDSLIASIGRAYPPSLYTWRALSNPVSWGALADAGRLLGLCLTGPVLAVIFLSHPYAASLPGFNEGYVKKMSKKDEQMFFLKEFKQRPLFLTLFMREFNAMNREPMYLLNGPFIIILLPLIMGVMFLVQRDALMNEPEIAAILEYIKTGAGQTAAALLGAFLGSGTSIACTALSRDAKALPYIKSLPLKRSAYMFAKLAHGLLFAGLGSFLGAGLLAILLGLSAADALGAIAVALALSALINMAGLWLDTANPRLDWNSPVAAMKQNPNSVIQILASMFLIGGAGYLSFTMDWNKPLFLLLVGLPAFLLFLGLAWLYQPYAEKRLGQLEA